MAYYWGESNISPINLWKKLALKASKERLSDEAFNIMTSIIKDA